MKAPPTVVLAGLAVGAAVLYVLWKKKPGESIAGAAGRVAVQAAGDAAVGAVKGAGAVVGIPDTNSAQCEADIAAGRWWDASFSCPAGRFVSGVWGSTTINAAAIDGERRIDRITELQQQQAGANAPAQFDEWGNSLN